jgi:G3E family GTPase
MMVGYSGVGKTKRINTVLESLPDEKVVVVPINFSAGTTAKST